MNRERVRNKFVDLCNELSPILYELSNEKLKGVLDKLDILAREINMLCDNKLLIELAKMEQASLEDEEDGE